jgi:hypothetical protein
MIWRSNCKWEDNIQMDIKGKAMPVTGCGGLLYCETSSLPHFLDNRLTDGGEVVSLYGPAAFYPRKIPGTHFC